MLNRKTTAPVVQTRARELRASMTPAEVVLWQRLRGKQLGGFKFRRQEPLGNFIADFFCVEAHLIIELDGSSHEGRAEADARRDEVLRAEGYFVLRFSNDEITQNLLGVLETIVAHCQSRTMD